MANKIKRCPHCAGASYLHSNYSYKCRCFFVFVKCEICGAQGKVYKSAEEPAAADWQNEACNDAVEAWNMRRSDTADSEEWF